MNTATTAQRIFLAERHHEDGCWWADSRQAPNWTAAANTPEELFRLVTEAPAFLFGWPGGYSTILVDAGPGEVSG